MPRREMVPTDVHRQWLAGGPFDEGIRWSDEHDHGGQMWRLFYCPKPLESSDVRTTDCGVVFRFPFPDCTAFDSVTYILALVSLQSQTATGSNSDTPLNLPQHH